MAHWLGIEDGTDEGLDERSSDGEPNDSGVVRGDPGRIHQEGMTARVAVETARESVAALVGARSREVVFTSGATESIAAATWGALERGASDGRRGVVLAAVEHSAVRQWAERGDARVVGVDSRGRIDPDELMAAVDDSTALVHIQWANHEVGTIQPVAEVVATCRDRGVLVHVDAAMAAGHLPIDFVGIGIDLMSISGHKFGAPTGTGALVVRRGLRIPPLLVGGDQERARRAGLENVVGAIGFGAAASEALGSIDAESARSTSLTDRVLAWAEATDGITVFGDPDHRLPHLVCLGLNGVEPQPVLIGLDQAGVAVHSGSSCSTESLEPSPVLEAMGVDAHRSLRVSVGWNTTDADIALLLEALPEVLGRLSALRTG
jgi:cysteine desulfurase